MATHVTQAKRFMQNDSRKNDSCLLLTHTNKTETEMINFVKEVILNDERLTLIDK